VTSPGYWLALAWLPLGAIAASCTADETTDAPRRATPTTIGPGNDGGAPAPSSTGTSGGVGDGGPGSTGDGGGGGPGGGTSPSSGETKTKCKYQAHKTGLTPLQQAGGLSFNVYAPATYDPKVGHMVVVIMHGQDSNGVPELTALWQPIADAEGLVLIAPKGSRPATTGNPDVGNWSVNDLNNVLDLMTDVDDCYNVFIQKHLLWGFSEGGFYGYTLGLGAAERFSGLAMGGSNTSFARENGFAPANAAWKIPVSHVHGTQDFNPISLTYQDRDDFVAHGHVFTLHEHSGGHSISPEQVRSQYDDLKGAVSPPP
jgi:poly(3-hydroxybutyrate) depolymerase